MYCRVFQCIVVFYNVVYCIAVYCIVLRCIVECCSQSVCEVLLKSRLIVCCRQNPNAVSDPHCVVVCFRVLQYVAVCCSVVQHVAVCCSMLLFVAVCAAKSKCCLGSPLCYSVFQCVAVCCSMLQCDAVCCTMLQCVAMCCSVLQQNPNEFSDSQISARIAQVSSVRSVDSNRPVGQSRSISTVGSITLRENYGRYRWSVRMIVSENRSISPSRSIHTKKLVDGQYRLSKKKNWSTVDIDRQICKKTKRTNDLWTYGPNNGE